MNKHDDDDERENSSPLPLFSLGVVPCDDRFTFPANIENLLNESFTYKDVKYTLIIVGFAALGSTGTTPIRVSPTHIQVF